MEMETPANTSNNEPESPISLSRFNIKPIPPRVQQTYFGKIRAFNTFSILEWVYLAIAIIALTASLGITIQRLTVEKTDQSDFTFALLLLLTIVFCYHYVIHSIFTERWDELMVFVVSNVIVLSYCIANYVSHERDTIKLIRLIFICVCSPFLIGVGVFQCLRYCRSNNLIYNTVGAISSLQSSCRLYYICSSLLKFDLQLQLSMLILVMGRGVANMDLEQKVILGSGVPVTFLFFFVGMLGLRYENRSLMVIFYILALFEPGYIVYKFYYTVTNESEVDAIYDSTFVCGYFALVIWLLLICSTVYFAFYYFGKGLKEKMFEDSGGSQPRRFTSTFSEATTSENVSVTQEP
ncbi:uncharacterized protein [Parasteatoda tepidariorum]|uniref:uncharacterized protein n=1 Tax=Parasteatoda tepidariorum TaxID=114398 RepID=UPI00077FAD19|nr:uncharacterized protein LOC107439652 [Parasteatoda tepidariorum]